MKITLIVSKGGWHTEELRRAATERNIKFETLNVSSLNDCEKNISRTGDIIVWFSSQLKKLDKKATFFHLMKDKVVMNTDCLSWPFLTRKLFQQKYLEKFSPLNIIPTFHFQHKTELLKAVPKKLHFPIIQKPNYGSQGDNISLLKNKKDILRLPEDISGYIYQNFIPNDGDYRILIIGGKAIGAIKRTAKYGGFLNNVSKGGKAVEVIDQAILKKIKRMAITAASIFDLQICGIDIIFDKTKKKYHLMEINTNPEWRGFQGATKIDVAGKIIDFCLSIHDRKKKSTRVLVREYFDNNFEYLDEQKFHYASRMWLWTGENFYRKKLDSLKPAFLEDSIEKQIAAFKKILTKKSSNRSFIAEELRKKYFKKYPKILAYNSILFKVLFAETIYGENIRPAVKNVINDSEIVSLRKKIEKDKEAILALSTFAVNFLYLAAYYLGKPKLMKPKLLLNVFNESNSEMEKYPDLKAYLLTHAIIGETKFYNRKIFKHQKDYSSMIIALENLIKNNYFKLSLDVKFEFLVCSKLCKHSSELEKMILDEADRSLAHNGNFLISQLNDSRGYLTRNILDAEHRNVLFIMANLKKSKFSITQDLKNS